MTPPHTWPLPATSSIARLQQLTGLSLLVWTVGLAVWGAESPDGTLAWALVPLLLHPGVLAMQFVLAYGLNWQQGLNAFSVPGMVRAWWGEVAASLMRFGWQQPWRWRVHPDGLVPAHAVHSGDPVRPGQSSRQTAQSAHPGGRRGVLLVHGFMCNRGLWSDWYAPLAEQGSPVIAVNLEPMLGSIDDYVATLDEAVTRLTAATGLPPLVVAHSMGGLAVRAWMRAVPGADARVFHVVTLGTPHHGTWLARWGHGTNARQMRYRSPWIQALAAAEPAGRYRLFTCWHTCGDNIVFPLGTAALHGAKVLYLPNVGHVALAGHPEVLAHTLALLRH